MPTINSSTRRLTGESVPTYCGYCNKNHPVNIVEITLGNGSSYRALSSSTINNIGEHIFQYGRMRPSSKQFHLWQDMDGSKKLIKDMNKTELRRAIKYLKDGWVAFGQAAKIVSLEKALEEKTGNE